MALMALIWPEICTAFSSLSERKTPRKPTQGERLAAIFEQAPAQEDRLDVTDFLPVY